jgi:hypothetical protein
MAGTYQHLIKPLSLGLRNWEEKKTGPGQPGASIVGPGNAKKETWLNGRDHLEGLGFNISWGVHDTAGEWHANGSPHSHSYPECLFFVGLDTATFNEPTVVIVPAGFPHGPIATKRLFSPRGFGFFAAGLNVASDLTWEKSPTAAPAPSTGKHAHLVKSLKTGLIIERGKFNPSRLSPEQRAQREQMQKATGLKPGPGHPDQLTWMYGKDLGGVKANLGWGFCSQPGIWQRGVDAHLHPADEIMFFLGIDPNRDDLGAEVEIDLGKEHERYLFDKSSAVICPAGLPHAPIVTRWVDRPFAFLLINLAADMTMSFA